MSHQDTRGPEAQRRRQVDRGRSARRSTRPMRCCTRSTNSSKAPFGTVPLERVLCPRAAVRDAPKRERQRASDNAHAEPFFHTLKAELARGIIFVTEHALRTQLQRYIRYTNTVRLHSSPDDRSPLAFERDVA